MSSWSAYEKLLLWQAVSSTNPTAADTSKDTPTSTASTSWAAVVATLQPVFGRKVPSIQVKETLNIFITFLYKNKL